MTARTTKARTAEVIEFRRPNLTVVPKPPKRQPNNEVMELADALWRSGLRGTVTGLALVIYDEKGCDPGKGKYCPLLVGSCKNASPELFESIARLQAEIVNS